MTSKDYFVRLSPYVFINIVVREATLLLGARLLLSVSYIHFVAFDAQERKFNIVSNMHFLRYCRGDAWAEWIGRDPGRGLPAAGQRYSPGNRPAARMICQIHGLLV